MATTQEVQAFFDESRNGCNGYIRHPLARRMVYTDGVRDLAELAGCYWLLDVIGTEFVDPYLAAWSAGTAGNGVIEIRVADDSAVIVLTGDDNLPPIHTRKIDYTDFPVGNWTLYIGPGDDTTFAVVLLPSEY